MPKFIFLNNRKLFGFCLSALKLNLIIKFANFSSALYSNERFTVSFDFVHQRSGTTLAAVVGMSGERRDVTV